MIFRSLAHVTGWHSNRSEAMPLIDFVTRWFRKPRVVMLHISNDSCFTHGGYSCRSLGTRDKQALKMVAHGCVEARRLLVSFRSVGRSFYEWRFEPLAVASIRG